MQFYILGYDVMLRFYLTTSLREENGVFQFDIVALHFLLLAIVFKL